MVLRILNSDFWLITGPRFSVPYFVISVLCAGYFYIDQPYMIANNFLSQLGQVYINGELNLISSILFNFAMIVSGTIIALFYYNIKKIFVIQDSKNIIAQILQITGILSGLFLRVLVFFLQIYPFHIMYFLLIMHSTYCLLLVYYIQFKYLHQKYFLINMLLVIYVFVYY